MNKALLSGNLGIPPTVEMVGDTIKTTLRLAVRRPTFKKDQNGDLEIDWFYVTVWGKEAGLCHKYLKKGSRVLVEGFLKVNEWTEDDGRRRFATEIVSQHVEFLDKVTKDEK